jgi:Asp-tRNA(Asn)/Glu-tRNA(Gln) amidotransferase A subunit family amidase
MTDEPFAPRYDLNSTRLLSFHDARERFADGSDTPRDYLQRCIATIEALEPHVAAFVCTNLDGARAAAQASTERYANGTPLSVVDGLPIGIKDLYETADMPTQMNSPVYAGWESRRDAACVYALRRSGAAIVGKTTTTEFGIATPDSTRNPFDYQRTPGGSSSGSSAAVGAGMLPAALGTQLKGSIIRPAGYCANYAIKPSYGVINRGGGHSTSPSGSHLGVHAGTLRDTWEIAHFLSHTAGPDAGCTAMNGPATLPDAVKPERIVRMYTPGWGSTPGNARNAFEDLLRRLADNGVEIIEPDSHPGAIALEADFNDADRMVSDIASYEMRWPMWTYRDRGEKLLSDKVKEYLTRAEAMSAPDYHHALAWREGFRRRHMAMAGFADAFISLSSPGPAPLGIDSVGDPVYQTPTSALGAPVFGLPLLQVDGLPQGVQLMGFTGGDHRTVAHARWICEALLGSPGR